MDKCTTIIVVLCLIALIKGGYDAEQRWQNKKKEAEEYRIQEKNKEIAQRIAKGDPVLVKKDERVRVGNSPGEYLPPRETVSGLYQMHPDMESPTEDLLNFIPSIRTIRSDWGIALYFVVHAVIIILLSLMLVDKQTQGFGQILIGLYISFMVICRLHELLAIGAMAFAVCTFFVRGIIREVSPR